MAENINMNLLSSKFSALQQDLINAKTPEEKIEIMLALCPPERREEEKAYLLEQLAQRKAKQ